MDQVCEIPFDNPDAQEIKEILSAYRSVAVVGLSHDEKKSSYQVAKYLKEHGFEIYPINPKYENILGKKCYPSLLAVPARIEIVDIFRRPSAVPEIVEEAVRCGAKVIWMQLGIVNNEAARRAREAGLKVVMGQCIMAEYKKMAGNRS